MPLEHILHFDENGSYVNYWDRSTGIVVEDSYVVRNQTGDYLTAWSMRVDDRSRNQDHAKH